ncbi:fungal-specific transcription factor domain-containing protein [Xylariomycetidae sp. FL0641]|nr:fungal-specific transcription factor domain-containing protein [Xylariomycetidae sp. FL0641]
MFGPCLVCPHSIGSGGSKVLVQATRRMEQTGSPGQQQQQQQQQPPTPTPTPTPRLPPPPQSPKRPARSKNGCMTCRRRKVRCNEIRPICGHCSRLNLECRWRPAALANGAGNSNGNSNSNGYSYSYNGCYSSGTGTRRARSASSSCGGIGGGGGGGGGNNHARILPMTPAAPATAAAASFQESFDDVFNYASFMWDGPDLWKPPSAWGQQQQDLAVVDQTVPQNPLMPPSFSNTLSPPVGNGSNGGFEVLAVTSNQSDGLPAALEDNNNNNNNFIPPNLPSEGRVLLDYFVQSVVPPIIAQVETQSRWAHMRQALMSMSRSCAMLRNAILAFSSLLLSRQGEFPADGTQKHYAQAVSDLAGLDEAVQNGQEGEAAANRAAVLATLFLLSYTDLLEGRNELTHANLEKAYDVYQSSEKLHFRAVEVRILSWIRLIDARAVSAGGQGLFLSETDEKLLAYSSPASFDRGETGVDEQSEADIEEVLFDILYQPGIVFFQKVQSFMGRISHQDPWHRRRGTVEDETEVMSIAAGISKDLGQLYEARPPLMDYAAAGSLTAAHLSATLAFTITRAFRTFLSNYHASRIHLHRVAYKSLPLTRETTESIDMIRNLAKLLVDGDAQDMLPVNMLWPLLMWGTEEKNVEERAWIKTQILRMEKVATNARITSQVLEEVQKRQDSMNARQDIREVMEIIFHSSWAIV